MNDRSVSLNNVAAWVLWVCAVIAVGVDLAVVGDDIGHVGMVLAAAAATLHVRSFLCSHLTQTENAFLLGRDAGRLDQDEEARLHRVR